MKQYNIKLANIKRALDKIILRASSEIICNVRERFFK